MDIRLTKSDLYIIALFFGIGIPVTFSGYDYSKGLTEPSLDTIIYVVVTFALAYIIVYKFFPKYFPEGKIITLFFWTVILMMLVGVLEILAYELVEKNPIKYLFKRYELWFWGISTSAQNAGILIGILLGKKFYEAQVELQTREKEKKENELMLLKSQIDPHFLFNNLNTVDALIDSDPQRAKIYVNRLSKLYRYLIRTKDDEVVSLEDELSFAKDYMYLLEQRFGDTFKFEIIQNVTDDSYLIPPGVLQTLLENVVKHNQGEPAKPIKTIIEINKENIEVRNNIKLKNSKKDSFGIGLTNLKARYALLCDEKIKIESDVDFSVLLPIIKSVD